MARIYLSPPDVGQSEEEAAVRAIRSKWVAPIGPEIDLFEEEVASYVGVSHAVALSSGTAALHLGLKAVGVSPGDSVITSTMTFVATANSISYNQANPVFLDCLDDGTIDPDLITKAVEEERRSGRRVGAIVPVDIFGRLANYSVISTHARDLNVPIVTDSAEAMGASRAGVMAGKSGEAGVLSFNGNKIMTTSGGGMLLTDNEEVADYVRYLATQARVPAAHYEHSEVGFNYRMSNVCAAIGRAQLVRLQGMIGRRRHRRAQYEEFFSNTPGVSVLHGDSSEDNCWLTSIRVDPIVAGWGPLELRNFLHAREIESRPIWKPMHLQPLYRAARYVGGEIAESLYESGLALPSGSAMTDSEMHRVLDCISAFLEFRAAS